MSGPASKRGAAGAALHYPSTTAYPSGAFADIPLEVRFSEALLCLTGATPPIAMVRAWLDQSDEALQSWVGACPRVPWWAQSLGILDAARVIAETPCEGDI